MNTIVPKAHLARLAALPAPPRGRTGWPWTTETVLAGPTRRNGTAWPRISVVTPSYNQAEFIEETIRSVLLQGYPSLEYIVVDGGSTDGSQAIIKKYAPWITHWVSEPDLGQADAINKGLGFATGEWFNFINSDDFLTEGALQLVGESATGCDAVCGSTQFFSPKELIGHARVRGLSALALIRADPETHYCQPAVWLRRKGVEQAGRLQTDLHYTFDWDLTIRYLALFPAVRYVDKILVWFRMHDASKTVRFPERFEAECLEILARLSRMPRFAPLHPAAKLRLRKSAWDREMQKIHSTLTGVPKALALARGASKDPAIRWSRFTLGAIRRALLSTGSGITKT